MKSKIIRLRFVSSASLILILSLLLQSVFIDIVKASPYFYPRQGYNTNNSTTVAVTGFNGNGSWGLEAPRSRYRIISTIPAPMITIDYSCEGNLHGQQDHDDADWETANGKSQTVWNIYRTEPATNRLSGSAIAYVSSAEERNGTTGNTCSTTYRPARRNILTSHPKSEVPGFTNYYIYEVDTREVSKDGDEGSGKGFRIRVTDASGNPRGEVTPVDLYTYQSGTVTQNATSTNLTVPSTTFGTAMLGRLRGGGGPATTNYSFEFSPDCRLSMPPDGSGRTVYMFWYDMDVGLTPNSTGNETFRIYEDGSLVNLRARRASGQGSFYRSAAKTTLSSTELNGGATGSARWGAAEFKVKRDARYRVEFSNVSYASNALEVYLPFADFHSSFSCPDVEDEIRSDIGSCDVIGYYYYPLVRSEKYQVNFQFRLRNTDGTWATSWSGTYTDVANRTGAEYQPGSGNGFRRAPPTSRISPTARTYVRAWVNYQNEPTDWLTNSTYGMNLGFCDDWFDMSSSAVSSSSVQRPGGTVTITFTASNDDDELNIIPPASRGTAPSVNLRTISSQVPGTQTLTLNSAVNITRDFTAFGSNRSVTITRTATIPSSAQVGGRYCTTLRLNKNYGRSSNLGLGGHPLDVSACVRVSDAPYLQVYGNDVWSGGAYDLSRYGDSCSAPSGSGDIRSHTDGSVGALSEYGAFAWGDIVGFGSSEITTGVGFDSLMFANTPDRGQFKAERCISRIFDDGVGDNTDGGNINDDLWNNADNLSDLNLLSNGPTYPSGQYRVGSGAGNDTTVYRRNASNFGGQGGNRLRPTKSFTIFVNGNLSLETNIVSDLTDWSMDEIPMIVFIVTGNIYIGPDVTQLDGVYISRQTINTCAIPGTLDFFSQPLAVDTDCDNHLEVNGQLIANNIAFRRVKGGINEASTGNGINERCLPSDSFYNNNSRRCAAETIIFPPAYYLADVYLDYGENGDPNDFPVQQLRDLPPIY